MRATSCARPDDPRHPLLCANPTPCGRTRRCCWQGLPDCHWFVTLTGGILWKGPAAEPRVRPHNQSPSMASTPQRPNPEDNPRVKAVFDDIRATRRTDFVNNMWRALAFDPSLLENTWSEVKRLMASETAIDPLTKEMIYIAVSVANGCGYCIHSHTAAARAKGMNDAQHAELLSIISLAAKTNHLATGMQVALDPVFDLSITK